MLTEQIVIANLSCGGCVNTITKKLTAVEGVEKVIVDLETNTVSINLQEPASREHLVHTLLSIGYPESTEKNGLLTQIKSKASCIIGKIS